MMMSLDIVGISRGLSITLLWLLSLVFTLSFVHKTYQHWKRDGKIDLRDVTIVLTFFGLMGSYLAGTTNFLLYLVQNEPLDVTTTVRLYAWGPIVAAIGILFFSTAFLSSRFKWLLNAGVIIIGIIAVLLIYPQPSQVVRVTYPGNFQETSFKDEALIAFVAVLALPILSLIIIFAYTAITVEDTRTRARSILITIGGLLFALAGVSDLMIAASLDPFLILSVRMFSAFSLIVVFSGFFYPKGLEEYILSKFFASGSEGES